MRGEDVVSFAVLQGLNINYSLTVMKFFLLKSEKFMNRLRIVDQIVKELMVLLRLEIPVKNALLAGV